jgi:hypothetical protein
MAVSENFKEHTCGYTGQKKESYVSDNTTKETYT